MNLPDWNYFSKYKHTQRNRRIRKESGWIRLMAKPLVKKKTTTWLLRAGLIASIPQTKRNLTVKMWRLTKIGTKWIQNINKPIKRHVRNQSIGQSAGHSCWTVHLKPSVAHRENSASWFGGMEETDWGKKKKNETKQSLDLLFSEEEHSSCKNLVLFLI